MNYTTTARNRHDDTLVSVSGVGPIAWNVLTLHAELLAHGFALHDTGDQLVLLRGPFAAMDDVSEGAHRFLQAHAVEFCALLRVSSPWVM